METTDWKPMGKKPILMTEGEFDLILQPEAYWISWISHTRCGSHPGRRYGVHQGPLGLDPDSRWCDLFGEVCPYCDTTVPQELLGVWRLHNYDNYSNALRIRDNTAR